MTSAVNLLALACIGMLSITSVHAETDDSTAFQPVMTMPEIFQGRWLELDIDGKTVSKCEAEGELTADTIIGPGWLLHGSGHSFLTKIEVAPSGKTVRAYLVYSSENVAVENRVLFDISSKQDALEIATNPQDGWEISNYRRCPVDA